MSFFYRQNSLCSKGIKPQSTACAEVFETFRNKQGNDSLRLFKDRVGRIWGNVTMPCKTTCLAFIIH